jgi:hypothetical protein
VTPTTPADPTVRAVIADAAAVIERLAADLALAEEPSGFVAALEAEPCP